MRLLHFDSLGRLILTNFRSKPIPPFAILSHRWSDSEVLIEDVLIRSYKEKEEGYRKLRFCAEQAAQAGLQYFWIDTCCIKRWDNNERSRAINSMFQWYQNASQCYVFMSDVSLSAVTETWEASFRKSEWFTRGWTLQELLAPESVQFFSREGQRIGNKASLDQLLHEVTGIPLAALHSCPLDQFSISERRLWVNNRRTTKDEDIVYCLLGVLGVSMATMYGEGKESALRRLQAEVKGANSAPSIIPFLQNKFFVGCAPELARLEAQLFSDERTTTVVAIVGLGGMGKSQLALEAAHRTRLNKNCSVFWIDASSMESLYRSFADVAKKLGLPGYNNDEANIKQVVQGCVLELSTRQCLLIFDNIKDTSVQSSSSSSMSAAAPLTDFLPHSKLCSVIFITTESDAAKALAPRNVIALHEPTPITALRMLQNRLTRQLSYVEQQEAMQLLEQLSYLPLAVVQAAACINASNMTVQQYRAQLAEYKEAASSDESIGGEQRETSLEDTVAATVSLSMDQVRKSNAVAVDYLLLAACVDHKDIPLDLLEVNASQVREDAIKILDRYALVTRRPAASALDLHQLVHSALRRRLWVAGQLYPWTQHAIAQLLWLYPDHDHGNQAKWKRVLPHVQNVLSHTTGNDSKERLDLAWKCAMALYSDGQSTGAKKLHVEVMRSMKRALTSKHPSTLTSMANLALTYRDQEQWGEAEELQAKELETCSRVLGDEHPNTLGSMNNLALTYGNQGQWKKAEELQAQVMQTMKRVLGNKHPNTLMSMANLALTYRNQERWEEAEELQAKELEICSQVLGDDHPNTLTSFGNLGLVLERQCKYEAAEAMHRRALKGREKALGLEHPDTLTNVCSLARLLAKQCRYDESIALYDRACAAYSAVLGGHHPTAPACRQYLSQTLTSEERWDDITTATAENRTPSSPPFVVASGPGYSPDQKDFEPISQAIEPPPSLLRLSSNMIASAIEATDKASVASSETLQNGLTIGTVALAAATFATSGVAAWNSQRSAKAAETSAKAATRTATATEKYGRANLQLKKAKVCKQQKTHNATSRDKSDDDDEDDDNAPQHADAIAPARQRGLNDSSVSLRDLSSTATLSPSLNVGAPSVAMPKTRIRQGETTRVVPQPSQISSIDISEPAGSDVGARCPLCSSSLAPHTPAMMSNRWPKTDVSLSSLERLRLEAGLSSLEALLLSSSSRDEDEDDENNQGSDGPSDKPPSFLDPQAPISSSSLGSLERLTSAASRRALETRLELACRDLIHQHEAGLCGQMKKQASGKTTNDGQLLTYPQAVRLPEQRVPLEPVCGDNKPNPLTSCLEDMTKSSKTVDAVSEQQWRNRNAKSLDLTIPIAKGMEGTQLQLRASTLESPIEDRPSLILGQTSDSIELNNIVQDT